MQVPLQGVLGARVMDGAVVVGANGEDGTYALAVDDDCGLGCCAWCYRLGNGVIGVLDLVEVSALHCFRKPQSARTSAKRELTSVQKPRNTSVTAPSA